MPRVGKITGWMGIKPFLFRLDVFNFQKVNSNAPGLEFDRVKYIQFPALRS